MVALGHVRVGHVAAAQRATTLALDARLAGWNDARLTGAGGLLDDYTPVDHDDPAPRVD